MLARLLDWLKPDAGPRPDPDDRSAWLPFDLYLTTGAGSLPLFPAGAIDELCFFQRRQVPRHHKVEFLSRLDPGDRGTEDYQPFGLVRLRRAEALTIERPQQIQRAWGELTRVHGLRRVPEASALIPGGFRAYRPDDRDPRAGLNQLRGDRRSQVVARGGRISHARLLEALRQVLDLREKIAWVEESFPDPPAGDDVVHRYYLGRGPELYLLRHTEEDGKLLFRAQTSAEALEACYASGHFRRPRTA